MENCFFLFCKYLHSYIRSYSIQNLPNNHIHTFHRVIHNTIVHMDCHVHNGLKNNQKKKILFKLI